MDYKQRADEHVEPTDEQIKQAGLALAQYLHDLPLIQYEWLMKNGEPAKFSGS